ncbi:MAG TPA: LysM peptidoglycan-binding domain-containing protein [Candidatus Acidoferrales bacterium]|nr:LysM peptidoglycan-binding domain-containing protein [Candidatus Acidoferrales bacterium]
MRLAATKLRVGLCALALAFLLTPAGCEESARRAVQVRPPEISPPAAPVALGALPLDPGRAQVALLALLPPSGLDALIENVEAAFQAGELNYRAGHLGKARQNFDQALDSLLSSGFDLQANPRLEELFDRIVDTVHTYEMAAFREGDGFSEQKTEPAPIEEIAEMDVPPPEALDPGLSERANEALKNIPHDLPLTVNQYVLSYLDFFQTPRGRAIVETGLRRAGRYRAIISHVLREEGMPQDLIYVAQAESAFQPVALSRAGARGIWQFMGYRGKQYGLQRSWWVDERQDPEKATRAAARHLRDLYQMFGDWYLVLAAYNSGPGHVAKAIERTGYADFWELYKRNVLPRETRNYVPIILALTLMAKDAARYGLQVDPEKPDRTDRVKPGHPIDLRLVAETIDVDVETLRSLNPQLLRMMTPTDPEFELQLPEGLADRFMAEIAAIPPEKWVSWRRHHVDEGETLSSIARKYHVTPAAVADANGLESHAELRVGDKLIIPAAARPQPALGKLIRYRVRRGDTLETIAEQFDVSAAELKKWNHLRGNRVARGMRLRVYPGGRTPPPTAKSRSKDVDSEKRADGSSTAGQTSASSVEPGAANPLVHRVKPGETLWSIAVAYRTTVEALRSANRFLFSRQLQVGDLLMIQSPR